MARTKKVKSLGDALEGLEVIITTLEDMVEEKVTALKDAFYSVLEWVELENAEQSQNDDD